MDVAGDRWVGIGPGGEVYLGNVRTGDVRQLTDDGHRKMQPVVYGDIVAWTDQSRGIETHDNNSLTHRGLADDIYVLDLNTGEKRRITEVPAKRLGLRISGNRLVWQDNRNEFGEHWSHFDIFAYDLETDEEIAVAVAPGPQSLGAIDGDRIVWSTTGAARTWERTGLAASTVLTIALASTCSTSRPVRNFWWASQVRTIRAPTSTIIG